MAAILSYTEITLRTRSPPGQWRAVGPNEMWVRAPREEGFAQNVSELQNKTGASTTTTTATTTPSSSSSSSNVENNSNRTDINLPHGHQESTLVETSSGARELLGENTPPTPVPETLSNSAQNLRSSGSRTTTPPSIVESAHDHDVFSTPVETESEMDAGDHLPAHMPMHTKEGTDQASNLHWDVDMGVDKKGDVDMDADKKGDENMDADKKGDENMDADKKGDENMEVNENGDVDMDVSVNENINEEVDVDIVDRTTEEADVDIVGHTTEEDDCQDEVLQCKWDKRLRRQGYREFVKTGACNRILSSAMVLTRHYLYHAGRQETVSTCPIMSCQMVLFRKTEGETIEDIRSRHYARAAPLHPKASFQGDDLAVVDFINSSTCTSINTRQAFNPAEL